MLERVKQLIRNFVILGLAGFIGGGGALSGQPGDELRRKYGEPIAEIFIVRPGISVTATYTKEGRMTELLISPTTTDLIKPRGKTLSRESVKEIIDELVPRSVRGKYHAAGFVNNACPENDCWGSSEDYDKVTIYYNGAEGAGVHYAVVQWKQ